MLRLLLFPLSWCSQWEVHLLHLSLLRGGWVLEREYMGHS